MTEKFMTAVIIKGDISLLSPTTAVLVSISCVTLIPTQSVYQAESTISAISQVFHSHEHVTLDKKLQNRVQKKYCTGMEYPIKDEPNQIEIQAQTF